MVARFTRTGKLFAVFDTPDAAERGVAALAAAGLGRESIEVLRGDADADRAFRPAEDARVWTRIGRAISFTQADQFVDFATYDAALRSGRTVVAVRIGGVTKRSDVLDPLKGAGAHFINYYGRIMTVDISPWRGERPDVSWVYHR